MENNITIRVRQSDLPLAENVLNEVEATYKQISNKEVHIKIEQESFLPAESCGGVELFAAKGKLNVNDNRQST